MRFFSLIVLAALSACTAADVQPSEPREVVAAAPTWSFAEQASALREQSCPDGVSFRRADATIHVFDCRT